MNKEEKYQKYQNKLKRFKQNRKFWEFNPVERIKPHKKIYKRINNPKDWEEEE